ncbi:MULTISPECIES: hypothetical protein [unclassified Streptomyces]|uniref:hypothetical protein n=1 Tax=unclassified Streptomyces TaxID=2593676 RepID=UPI0004C43F10
MRRGYGWLVAGAVVVAGVGGGGQAVAVEGSGPAVAALVVERQDFTPADGAGAVASAPDYPLGEN